MKEKEFASMSKRRRISNAICYTLLILISVVWLFPFFGLIMQSFRSYSSEYGGMVNYIIPKKQREKEEGFPRAHEPGGVQALEPTRDIARSRRGGSA